MGFVLIYITIHKCVTAFSNTEDEPYIVNLEAEGPSEVFVILKATTSLSCHTFVLKTIIRKYFCYAWWVAVVGFHNENLLLDSRGDLTKELPKGDFQLRIQREAYNVYNPNKYLKIQYSMQIISAQPQHNDHFRCRMSIFENCNPYDHSSSIILISPEIKLFVNVEGMICCMFANNK